MNDRTNYTATLRCKDHGRALAHLYLAEGGEGFSPEWRVRFCALPKVAQRRAENTVLPVVAVGNVLSPVMSPPPSGWVDFPMDIARDATTNGVELLGDVVTPPMWAFCPHKGCTRQHETWWIVDTLQQLRVKGQRQREV